VALLDWPIESYGAAPGRGGGREGRPPNDDDMDMDMDDAGSDPPIADDDDKAGDDMDDDGEVDDMAIGIDIDDMEDEPVSGLGRMVGGVLWLWVVRR
jgi:hypothetical protein